MFCIYCKDNYMFHLKQYSRLFLKVAFKNNFMTMKKLFLKKKNILLCISFLIKCAVVYFFLNKNQFIIRKNKNKSDYIVEKQKKTAFDAVF